MNGSTLTSLLWFLGFGTFFYWMMKRGGCGMHAHGDHGTRRELPDAFPPKSRPGPTNTTSTKGAEGR